MMKEIPYEEFHYFKIPFVSESKPSNCSNVNTLDDIITEIRQEFNGHYKLMTSDRMQFAIWKSRHPMENLFGESVLRHNSHFDLANSPIVVLCSNEINDSNDDFSMLFQLVSIVEKQVEIETGEKKFIVLLNSLEKALHSLEIKKKENFQRFVKTHRHLIVELFKNGNFIENEFLRILDNKMDNAMICLSIIQTIEAFQNEVKMSQYTVKIIRINQIKLETTANYENYLLLMKDEPMNGNSKGGNANCIDLANQKQNLTFEKEEEENSEKNAEMDKFWKQFWDMDTK